MEEETTSKVPPAAAPIHNNFHKAKRAETKNIKKFHRTLKRKGETKTSLKAFARAIADNHGHTHQHVARRWLDNK